MNRLPICAATIVGLAAACHALPAAEDILRFERTAVANGEFWRLFTCHGCHISSSHLWWNSALILMAGGILERRSRRQFLEVIALGVIGIGPLLFICLPDLISYAGLSGLGAGLVAAETINGLRQRDHTFGIWVMIAVLLSAKMIYETFDPSLLLVNTSSHRSVPLAHLIGVLGGIASALMATERRSPLPETQPRCSGAPRIRHSNQPA